MSVPGPKQGREPSINRKTCVLALGSLLIAHSAFAETQDAPPSDKAEAIEQTASETKVSSGEAPAAATPEDSSKDSLQFLGRLFVGSLNVETSAKREVDKKGPVYGAGLGALWQSGDVLALATVGYLAANTKGTGEFIRGDQEANVASPYLELSLGYAFLGEYSAGLSLSTWFAEGSDFAPTEIHEDNRLYASFDLGYRRASLDPYSFRLSYLSDLNVKDRKVSGFTVGLDYRLPY